MRFESSEAIGIKSTQIHALSGEEIIVSNSSLTGDRIRNYKRMNERRVEFSFRVNHATAREHL